MIEGIIWAIPKKNTHGWGEGWGHGISRDIEERACGNSRDQLKKKWNFQACSRKTHVEFPWVLALYHRISKGVTQLCRISRGESLFSPQFLRVKRQIHWGFSEKYILNQTLPPPPPCLPPPPPGIAYDDGWCTSFKIQTWKCVTIFDLNSQMSVKNRKFFQINIFVLLNKICKICNVVKNPRHWLLRYINGTSISSPKDGLL